MPIILDATKKAKEIEVIAFKDSAVNCTRKEYEIYQESFDQDQPDEHLLKLNGEPTRFVFTTELDYAQDTAIQKSEISIVDGKSQVSGTIFAEQFRMCFVNVINPADTPKEEYIKFKKQGSGGASIAFMTMLKRAGILNDLMNPWMVASNEERKLQAGQLDDEQEKKS